MSLFISRFIYCNSTSKPSPVGCLTAYSALCDVGAHLVQAGMLQANGVPGPGGNNVVPNAYQFVDLTKWYLWHGI